MTRLDGRAGLLARRVVSPGPSIDSGGSGRSTEDEKYNGKKVDQGVARKAQQEPEGEMGRNGNGSSEGRAVSVSAQKKTPLSVGALTLTAQFLVGNQVGHDALGRSRARRVVSSPSPSIGTAAG